MEELSNSN